MRGYGNDYDDRNWLERAGDTVRGWFGAGGDYDSDYRWGGDRGMGHPHEHEGSHGGYRGDWNRDQMGRHLRGGYDRMDYRGHGGGMGRGMRDDWRSEGAGWGRESGYDRDYGRDWSRGTSGGMGMGQRGRSGQPMRGMRGGGRGAWEGGEYGDYGTGGWGDYSGGGYGGSRWRNSTSGGVEPGRYFRGYGNGSTGGSGYSPY